MRVQGWTLIRVLMATVLLCFPWIARAQVEVKVVGVTAHGALRGSGDQAKVWGIPKGEEVTLTVEVGGGPPPFQVWVEVPQGGSTPPVSGAGPRLQVKVKLYHNVGDQFTAIVHTEDSVGRPATTAIEFSIKEPTKLRPPKPVRATPTPRPTPLPGSPYTPIQGVSISGPTTVKVGSSNTWVATFSGGVKPLHFRWRVSSGAQQVPDKTTLKARFSTPQSVTLFFDIWDDHVTAAKPTTASLPVQVVANAAPAVSRNDVSGYWLWVKPGGALVPIRLTKMAGGKFSYRGVYFPFTSLQALAQTGDKSTAQIGLTGSGPGSYPYVFTYPGGVGGKGTLTFQGDRARGDWTNTKGPSGSGQWEWRRPTVMELQRLIAHFEKR